MISSSRLKLLRSLQHKKFRDQHRLFLVEGEKMVRELMDHNQEQRFRVREIYATPQWIDRNLKKEQSPEFEVVEATEAEIKKVSQLVSPQPVLALVSMPDSPFEIEELLRTPVLAFESIRDPGNLGTIIRTADWFGMDHIVCTPDSTDVFNPKVVQSTMGAIARVKVHYYDLNALLENLAMKGKAVYGTYLDGENIYEMPLEPAPLILFGNESHGLSKRLESHIGHRISIPSFSVKGKGSESLNVASSVAVICSEVRRIAYSK
jgi:TrmH family RNA methyltransferase